MGLTINLQHLDGFNGFRLRGIDAGDLSGWYVNHAGDVNADGLDDIIIGARKGNGDGLFDAGEAYVVYGNAAGFAADFDLSGLDGTNGFQINGAAKKDQAGRAVSAAGDVNGDGIDDLIIGAWQHNADGFTDSGATYVVFGQAGGLGAAVALADLDGTDGFRIDGGGTRFYTGYSVSAAGDVNADGVDDVIIGAWAADVNGVNKAGQAYVVFGGTQGFAPDMDLAALDGTNGFALDGWADDESVGYSVSEAGDINGDGIDDIVLSSLKGTANGKAEAGQTFVVFGSAAGFSANMAMNALDGTNGFVLNGANAFDRAGYSVAHAGDVNGDGLDDIIIGSRWVDMAQGADVGQAYVVYGSTNGFAAEMDLGALNGVNGFTVNGVAAGDWTGGSVAGAGDVNGDGIDDIVIGAWLADAGGVTDAGSTFVVYGKAGGLASHVDLATLHYTEGFRVDGYEADAHSGRFVDGAGDLNGDGYDDVIIGAFQDDNDAGDVDAGESYVIYGFATPDGAPIAANSAGQGHEDTAIAGQATATDLDGDALSYAVISGPQHGSVTMAAYGSYLYTPDADFFGADGFTFRADDGTGKTGDAFVTLNVVARPDAPVAAADAYAIDVGGALAVAQSQGVLANDVDVDGDALEVSLVTGPSNGALSLNADGSFTYTPDFGFEGADSFEYQIDDGGRTDTAWADITVAGAAPPPMMVGLSFGGNAAARTAVYTEGGVEMDTTYLRYYFNDFAVGNSGIFVSAADPVLGARLSTLSDGLGIRADDDGSLARRLVDGGETMRFDLVEGAQFGDALSFDASLVMLGGAGQMSLDFYDDGALVESAVVDVIGGAVSYDLVGERDFDAVVMGTVGGLSYAVDDVNFLRTSSAPATPIGDLGRIVSLDFTTSAGGKTHVAYAEDGAVIDTLNTGYYRDVIGLGGGSVELRAGSDAGDAVKLTTLGEGLGVRSYGASDDVSVSAERRTLDDAETITLTLSDTAELGDALLICFDFAKTSGTGQLMLDFYDDGALVEQAAIDVLSASVTHDLAGQTDFDEVVIGTGGTLGVDIAEITMVREELFGA